MSGSHKYSANEALAFILASDSDSNDSFGNESSLDSSDSHDSEEGPCFRGTGKSFDVSSLFWIDKAVTIMTQPWNTM